MRRLPYLSSCRPPRAAVAEAARTGRLQTSAAPASASAGEPTTAHCRPARAAAGSLRLAIAGRGGGGGGGARQGPPPRLHRCHRRHCRPPSPKRWPRGSPPGSRAQGWPPQAAARAPVRTQGRAGRGPTGRGAVRGEACIQVKDQNEPCQRKQVDRGGQLRPTGNPKGPARIWGGNRGLECPGKWEGRLDFLRPIPCLNSGGRMSACRPFSSHLGAGVPRPRSSDCCDRLGHSAPAARSPSIEAGSGDSEGSVSSRPGDQQI